MINEGDAILIRDVHGREHPSRALSGVEAKGHHFPVVWVERSLAAGGTDRVPWPADAVRAADVSESGALRRKEAKR